MEEPSSFFSEAGSGWMASSTTPFSRSDLGGGGGALPTSTPVEAMVSVVGLVGRPDEQCGGEISVGGVWAGPASIYLLEEERKELDDEAHGGWRESFGVAQER